MLRPSLPRQLACLLAFLLLWGGFSPAQAEVSNARSLLRGRVLDQNRAAIPGAKVVAEATAISGGASTVTDQNGEFSLTLESGEYLVRVTVDGFADASQTIRLNQGSNPFLEVILQVAGANSSVTVEELGGYQVDAIGSATKTLTPLRDIPQSITVVTNEQIKDQMFMSISDVVRYMPGITAHQGENNRDEVVIRGNRSSADFFLNGVRDDVQYYRDLYNLDRVETMKGPNAMIFGRGGGGGVINRVTKEAYFAPLREISFQGGSFSNKRVSADFEQPINEKFAFRANGVYENSGSFRKFVDLKRYGINPTITIVPGSQTRITFGYEYFHDGRTADRGITSFLGRPADVPIDTFYGNPDDSHVRADVNLLSATLDQQVGKLKIHNRTLFGDYDRSYQNYVPGTVNSTKTLTTLTAYNNATQRRNLFNQTDVVYAASTGRIQHTLVGGLELGQQRTRNLRNTGFFNNTATSVQVPYDNPTISIPVTFRPNATDANNRLRLNLAATYLQDQIEISRHVQVIAGVRYDYFDLKYHNNRNGDDLRRIDNLVSPRLGVVLKPVTEVSLYGNYSVSYLPSAGDQFASLTSITQQLKPEKFTNFEFGIKWDLRRFLSLTSAVYRLNRTNTRSTDPNNPANIIQTGSQRSNGVEVGVNGSITRDWSMAGGYAYQDAFITSATTAAVAGRQVAQVPHHTLSLWNKYQIRPRLGVGLGLVYRSDMFAAVDNTVVLPAYTRVDTAVFYSFNEHWRLQANFENLFNRTYYVNADSNTNISPGSPRAARVGLTARF
ncbi:MAG TPA: TonB-dependent siderophore receptor [Pyrinomonadaceae bacterium]